MQEDVHCSFMLRKTACINIAKLVYNLHISNLIQSNLHGTSEICMPTHIADQRQKAFQSVQ